MTDNQAEGAHRRSDQAFAGFAEIDEAIRDNRLMEYRIKKSWADPWARSLTIAVLVVIAAGFSYLAGASFGLW
jgi:hypothetical protein